VAGKGRGLIVFCLVLRHGNLSSSGHRFSNVDLNDPNFETTPYEPFVAYGRSKTANILFAVEFDRRHRERGVRATAVHPGGIQTELARHMDPSHMEAMIKQINEQAAAEGNGPLEFKTIPQGSATSVWAGVVATAEEIGGRYCENCHVSDVVADDVSRPAIVLLLCPSAAGKTIRARSAKACAVLGRRAHDSSSSRCSEERLTHATGRPVRIDTPYCIR
jgi:NAD(P)-dependent dehydrogenase (short-subunit alcohol dehydrogenase family)